MTQLSINPRSALAPSRVKRNAYEPPMTEDFWLSAGRGTLYLEFPLVIAGNGSERRRVDGLIVLDGEPKKRPAANAPDLNGKSVIVVQTIAGATDAAHVGQALLSPWLLRQRYPKIGPIESVLVTASPEPFLTALLQRHGVREVAMTGSSAVIARTHLRGVPESELDLLHAQVGGEMLIGVHLPADQPLLTTSAVIVSGRPFKRTVHGRGAKALNLRGEVATAVVSTTERLGMYVAGFALVARELLLAAGAKEANAIALVGTDDKAIHDALGNFPGVTARDLASLQSELVSPV